MIATEEWLLDGKQTRTDIVVFPPHLKLAEVERMVILQTLQRKNYNRTHTAKCLGIGIRTLQRKLKQYGLQNWGLTPGQDHP